MALVIEDNRVRCVDGQFAEMLQELVALGRIRRDHREELAEALACSWRDE